MGSGLPYEDRIPRKGKTIREIAEKTGFSTASITRWTSENREVWLERAAERREKIHQLRAQGLTMRAIAAEVGCGVGTVHRALKKDPKSEAAGRNDNTTLTG